MPLCKLSFRVLALLFAFLLSQPLALTAQKIEPRLPDPGKAGMNRDQQQKLGLQAAGEVYKEMPVLPDSSPETRYVEELGGRLKAVIPPDRSWPYQFHVIPSADINAFALPGGQIFVNLATIQAANNEAELAGVLAHEMSHVYMQHSAKQAPKSSVAQLIAGLAGAVLPDSSIGTLTRMGIQIGAGTMLMKYSRKDEAQADSVGAVIMYRAGYNPKAMADFFETLEKKYGSGGPQFLSDHPNPGNRQASIQKEISNWPARNYASNSNAFTRVKENAQRIKIYSGKEIADGAKSGLWLEQNKKNGVLPANIPVAAETSTGTGATDVSFSQVRPSGNFTQFQGNGFTLRYPDNWKPAAGQDSTVIAPAAGTSNAGISYGVIVGSNPGNGTDPLDTAMRNLSQALIQQNPGMRAATDVRTINVNGTEGRSMELAGNSPLQQNGQPIVERDWLVAFPRPQGGLLYLVFVSPERDFNQMRPTYQRIMESIQLR